MPPRPKILAFAGSLRQGSYNKKLVRIAARGAERAGASVTLVDLAEHPLPVFNEDFESAEGLPPQGRVLKELFRSHDGLLISSPEYNSSLSAALKNTIDWVSRPEPNQPPLSGFRSKVAGIMAASPGGLGGLRGLVHLRAILENIQVVVVPNQVAVPTAHEALDDAGELRDDRKQAQVEQIGADVTEMLAKLLA